MELLLMLLVHFGVVAPSALAQPGAGSNHGAPGSTTVSVEDEALPRTCGTKCRY